MAKIFVTGAAGFVGGNLVPRLLAEGHEVGALVRPGASATLPPEVRVSSGDVRDSESAAQWVAGADVVIHLASTYGSDGPDIIEGGTKNLTAAAAGAGVQRLILLSCLPANAAAHAPFFRAKWRAEQAVRASGVPYVVLRPSVVLGPGDSLTRPLAELIRSFPVIPVPGSGRQRHQPIDVLDLCECVARSISSDEARNVEVSVGGPMFLTLRQLIDLIQGAIGTTKPKVLVPQSLVPRVAGLLPRASRELFAGPRLAILEEMSAASPGIVQREFNFTPRSIVDRLGSYL